MYDLILCVLATTKNNRLEQFNKIGYKPTTKFKTKVVFLQHNEERPLFLDESEEWHNCKNHHFPNRFVEYLQNTTEEFRWIMQVDDDSCTDLEKTIELLDYYYDYQDNLMLTSSFYFRIDDIAYLNRDKKHLELNTFVADPVLQDILKDLGDKSFESTNNLNNFDVVPHIETGWEHSVFSKKAFEKIQQYEKLKYFVESCEKKLPSFSDQVPFVLSRLAKIPISSCHFFSPLPNFEEYSVINKKGRFAHIHHVAEYLDQKEVLERVIENKIIFENKDELKLYFDSEFQNTCWMFYAIQSQQGLNVYDPKNSIISRCALKFEKEKIKMLDYPPLNVNESFLREENKFWEKNENQILFRDSNNPENHVIFNKQPNETYICNAQNNCFYVLSRIDKNDLMYLAHNKLNNPERFSWPIKNIFK